MKLRKYKRGDLVAVWSLQSFNNGGFLEGEPGIVRQDQNSGKSVLVAVTRKIDGKYMIDSSYEVYHQQLELIEKVTPERLQNMLDFLEMNQKLRTYEHTKLMKKGNSRECTPYHYSPEYYLDENNLLQLDKDKLEYPEAFI